MSTRPRLLHASPEEAPAAAVTAAPGSAIACDVVVLGVRPGHRASARPPVRIFLGTESAQFRAQRVFVYSVERHRDPSRVYEIYLMKDLPGFARRGWRTGFTNYRFAIPELAGGVGRAVYNDVDQIYTSDPAELFDLDLQDHAVLAISRQDTSVMLLDCERMLPWWNLDAARRLHKRELTAVLSRQPHLWGALDPRWNARDLEYRPGRGGVLHFTALHTQPWRPTPRQYSYHPHPLGDLWFTLEREADAEGFHPFQADQPSAAYRQLLGSPPGQSRGVAGTPQPLDEAALRFLERYGGGRALLATFQGPVPAGWKGQVLDLAGNGGRWPDIRSPGVLATHLLEPVPEEDVPWLLDRLFASARRALVLRIDPQVSCRADRRWWRSQVERAAARRPGLCWQLELGRGGALQRYASTWAARESAPRVWVLAGARGGDNQQLFRLAESLGWPWERRHLAFNPLHLLPPWMLGERAVSRRRRDSDPLQPPWPDLVLACGKRSAPVARWIRRQSGGRTRLVHLGRPRAPLGVFDLILSTPQYRLPARDNILHLTAALNRRAPAELEAAAREWASRLDQLPRPWYALVVGGNRWPYVLSPKAAARLGGEASDWVAQQGGSLLVTTGPRTPPKAASCLAEAITVPAYCHRFGDPGANPYTAFLALADGFLVSGDSGSALAETAATGRPVWIVDMPRRYDGAANPLGWGVRALQWYRNISGDRGTPHQQNALDRALDRLTDLGLFTPPRDMGRYHEALLRRGMAAPLGMPAPPREVPGDDLQRAVEAVVDMMREARPVDRAEQ